jgi:hypothetical protein
MWIASFPVELFLHTKYRGLAKSTITTRFGKTLREFPQSEALFP